MAKIQMKNAIAELDNAWNHLRYDKQLMERGIFAELTTGNILMCMTGIGNTKADMERLLTALREISCGRTAAPS